ncbi:hypothetical protein HYALB_00011159 [Hymenoscyphus albidus]|uniref:Uncharacterized protein n=1 Tax=Hymenoscyphus albidus TaxID=595503 RepID=A0A9N9Q7A8_9HELO|nr:hypothetical protein HYALB_00011159 [Hymenoscyphus albidus]
MNGSSALAQAAIQKAKQGVANVSNGAAATKKRKKELKPIITTEGQQDADMLASSNQGIRIIQRSPAPPQSNVAIAFPGLSRRQRPGQSTVDLDLDLDDIIPRGLGYGTFLDSRASCAVGAPQNN